MAWPCPGHTVELVCVGQSSCPAPEQGELLVQLSEQGAGSATAPSGHTGQHCLRMVQGCFTEFFLQVAERTKAYLLGKFVPRELWCSEGHQLKLSHVEMTADLPAEICSESLVLYEPLNYCISASFVSVLSCFSFHAVKPLNKVQIAHHFSRITLWHLPLLCLSGVSITHGHQLGKSWCMQHGRAQTCGTVLNLSGEKVWLEGRTGPN